MKLTTIWTLRKMSLSTRLAETGNALALSIAARLPKRVKYWAFVLVGTKAMDDEVIVGNQLFVDLMERAEGAPK